MDDKKKKVIIQAKILIGVSILTYSHEFVQSFLKFWTELITADNKGYALEIAYMFQHRRPVHMAQEALAEHAVATGCTHVLLMDDDIYDVTLEDLVKLVKADKDVIGGIMYTSGFPYSMCAFRRYDLRTRVAEQPILDGAARLYEIPEDQRKGIQPADLIPFGFTLIKTSALSEIPKPWFECNMQAPTDSWFMDTVMDAGIQPYAHFDVWLNHNKITRGTKDAWFQLGIQKQQEDAKIKDLQQVMRISPDEMNRHMMAMDMKLKDAEKAREAYDVQETQFIGPKGVKTHVTQKELSR